MKQKLISLLLMGLVLTGVSNPMENLNNSTNIPKNEGERAVQIATIDRPEPWSLYETATIDRPEPWGLYQTSTIDRPEPWKSVSNM